MTAVMQAIAVDPHRVLRVGVLEGGKLVDERVFRDREDVTIGTTEKNTFVVSRSSVARSRKLFERSGDRYRLRILDGMTGRVASGNELVDIATLRAQSRADTFALAEDARGRVTVDGATFLFQLVAAPPLAPRPQLPLSVKAGSGIDWLTTVIAAFSFLFHFGIVGAIYSDWLDPIVDQDIAIGQLVEAVKALPQPPVTEPKETPDASRRPPSPCRRRGLAGRRLPKST